MPPEPPPVPKFDWKKLAEAKIVYEKLRLKSRAYLAAQQVAGVSSEPAECPETAEEICQALTNWYWEHFNPWAEWVTNELGGDPGGTPPPPPPPFK